MAKIFIRQSFTQADKYQQVLIQDVMNEIATELRKAEFLTGLKASDSDSFASDFELTTGLEFTPKTFRDYRLNLLAKCDAMIVIRTSLSESGSFELACNLHSKKPKPVFFAHWVKSPIKTTLLRELDRDYPVMYKEFYSAKDLTFSLRDFATQYDLIEDQIIDKISVQQHHNM